MSKACHNKFLPTDIPSVMFTLLLMLLIVLETAVIIFGGMSAGHFKCFLSDQLLLTQMQVMQARPLINVTWSGFTATKLAYFTETPAMFALQYFFFVCCQNKMETECYELFIKKIFNQIFEESKSDRNL